MWDDEQLDGPRRSLKLFVRKTVVGAIACVCGLPVVLSGSANAVAQEVGPDDFTPNGYKYCGWRQLEHGGWKMTGVGEPTPGPYVIVFARHMRCRAARRNYARTRMKVPDGPVRKGYRCARLEYDYDFGYSDFECTKRRRPSVSYMWRTGTD